MALAIVYRIQVLLKPSYIFLSITGKKTKPEYFNNVRSSSLDAYLPRLTAKALDNLQLSNIVEPESLYKIVTPECFDPSHLDNCVNLSTLDRESHFIHASQGGQVPQILEKFFKDSSVVLLLELDGTALNNANITLKKEQNKVEGEFFPHLYGAQKIPLSIVKTIIELNKKDGNWTIDALSIVVPCTARA
jgi:uncharacterized protein (DUF952 family)